MLRYSPLPRIATESDKQAMEIFDGNWIASRLSGRHGEKAALARAMGIEMDKLSKTLKGERQVQPREIPGLLAFFEIDAKEIARDHHDAQGMAEPEAMPYLVKPGDPIETLLQLAAPGAGALHVYRATRSSAALAILKNDVLGVAMGAEPSDGDTLIAAITDPNTGEAYTRIRKLLSPWLVDDPCAPMHERLDDPDLSVGILGVVRTVLRR